MSRSTALILLVTLLPVLGTLGCSQSPSTSSYYDFDPASIEFEESVETNRESPGSVTDLEFVDTNGQSVKLADFIGNQHVLLVFTRGFSGQICPYCTTQTSRLIANYEKFVERNTEVLLVYPGKTGQIDDFRQASLKDSSEANFPFPILLDENLTAVKQLDIEARVAFPSSFIIDKEGQVVLSYVGRDPSDRPSIKALLTQLDSLM